MTDEASFAMQYAAERKKRMELEHRVYGLHLRHHTFHDCCHGHDL